MVQGRHGKKWMTALLLAALLLLLTPAAQAEEMPSFRFSLSANGKTEVQAQPGDVIALLLRLERTDSDDPYTMYAMQDEVVYDPLFLQFLPENSLTAEGVRIADALGGGRRRPRLLFSLRRLQWRSGVAGEYRRGRGAVSSGGAERRVRAAQSELPGVAAERAKRV